MANVFIVHNPVSGTQTPDVIQKKIQNFFTEKQWDYTIHTTQKDEDTPALIADKLNDYDLFIAAGGDGTISAVASVTYNTDKLLGIIPIGTGNGLASDLRIPLDVDQALELIYSRLAIKSIDTFIIKDRHYLLNMSIGFTSLAMEKATRQEKRKLGRFAYFLGGLKALIGIQPNTFQIVVDGRKIKIRASEIIVLNSITLGDAGRYLNLGVKHDDGKLDLFAVKSKNLLDYLNVVAMVTLRRLKTDPRVVHFYIQDTLSIQSKDPIRVQADGELIGFTPVELQLVPQSVNIIVPESDKTP